MPNLRLILVVALVITILAYVAVLVSGNLKDTILDGFTSVSPNTNTFTLYYMNGCPHCESILPAYKDFVAAGLPLENGKKVQIRMLEQSNPAAAPELEKNKVKGFPTFILNTAAGDSLEYKGDREVSAMREFISRNAV